MTSDKGEEMVKVQFWDKDVGYENIWATPLGDDLYRLESIPYFIYRVSLHDIVLARSDSERTLAFVNLVEPSGHRTLRARSEQFTNADEGTGLLSKLRSLGSALELLPPRLVAIDIPGDINIKPITEFLQESGIQWEYANPTAGGPFLPSS